MPLSPELEKMRVEIEKVARDYGLDFPQVIFEMLEWKEINVVASYGGFPSRYPHWRFGMEFEHLSKSYTYGLSKIYEMVINNDPCYAYLLASNSLVDQKMVMAHVFGHADFFKNNLHFKHTNRKMMDEMGNHRAKVQRYMNDFGVEKVESFIDRCLSLENLIDLNDPIERRLAVSSEETAPVTRFPTKPYMERYINPKKRLEADRVEWEKSRQERKFPERAERDVLGFLVAEAPLEDWERDTLSLIREEAYYFSPQAATKIMNEGWASYWHSKIMTQKMLNDSDVIDYALHHAGTVSPQPGKLNPYKMGLELFRDIERRWGFKKIFEVRALYNDLSFMANFLNEEFCREQKFFVYGFNQANGTYEITDRDFEKVREKLLAGLTNFGSPVIQIIDANYAERGELGLKHLHEGVDLRIDWTKETMKNLHSLWKKTVHLETIIEGIPKLLSFDGEEHREQRVT